MSEGGCLTLYVRSFGSWRLPGDRADPSSYSHQTLISSPITSNIVMLPEDQTVSHPRAVGKPSCPRLTLFSRAPTQILTLLSPSHLTALLTSPAPSAIPPSAYSDLWHPLVTLTTEAYESYASPSDVEPTSSTVLASLLMPFLDGPIGSAFPAVDKDELVKMLGGRRGLSEEGRKVVAKGVEVIGGLMVRAIMGGGSEGVEKELRPSEADQRADESQAATVFVLPSSSEVKRNRRQDQTTTRRRSPSSSSTSTPSIAAEPRPSPAPDHITPHLTQISSQIDRLSREIAALAAALPPPVAPAPPPQQEPASPPASRMVSPPLSPSPFFHTSPHLAILAIASVLVGSVCLLLSSLHHPPPPFSNGLASCPLPASPPALDFELISAKDTVRANRAWVLKTVADYAEEAALPRRPDEGHVGQKDQAEADPDRRSRTKRDR